MLCPQDFDEVDEQVGLFETRKEKTFFELLVIILNKAANNSRGISQSVRWKVLLCIEASQHFAVNQKHTFQDAMLPHQIFRRTDLSFFFFTFLFPLGAKQQTRTRQCGSGKDNATSEKNSAVKKSLFSALILHVSFRHCPDSHPIPALSVFSE